MPEPPADVADDPARYAAWLAEQRELRALDGLPADGGEASGHGLPPLVPLAELLAEPDEPVTFRLEGLLPVGARALLAAQYKSGKTTARDNLVRSLADGTPFLGRFGVTELGPGETVVVLDNEMSRGQLRRWLRDQGIQRPERVHVVVLRGKVASFNIIDRYTRYAWAQALREVGAAFVVFDCLRPVLDALGLDESRDAGRFLVAFDALLSEAGVSEAVVVHHMGHQGERSRGDSRLRDWPDVEWRLVRQSSPGEEPDPSAARFFSAYGRDVDVPEGAVEFDPITRHLTLGAGNRKDAAAREALPMVLDALAAGPLSGRQVEDALKDAQVGRNQVRAALKLAQREGLTATEPGPKNATLHRLSSPVRQSAPEWAARTEIVCASALIQARTHSLELDQEEVSAQAAHTTCHQCGADLDRAALLAEASTCTSCELREVAG